jgi:hypothetical protein
VTLRVFLSLGPLFARHVGCTNNLGRSERLAVQEHLFNRGSCVVGDIKRHSPGTTRDPTKPQDDDKVVSATNLVTINVIVSDRDGRYVKGLGREQFEVYDEKVKQQITHCSAEAAPVSLGIVCEIHSATPAKTRAMLTALKQFTRSLRNDDDFFFMAFGKQGSVTTEFVPTADQVLDHLAAVRQRGPSALFDAVTPQQTGCVVVATSRKLC